MKTRLLRIGGAVLVLAGVSALAYGVGAVWIGDARTSRAQERLAADLEANRTTTTTAPAFDDDPTVGPATTTATTLPQGSATTPPASTTTLPPLITEEPPGLGEALGRILIPAADVNWVLVEGVSQAELALGPGHMPGTAMPGQPGNAVISGHRTTHGAPFFDLDLVRPGDEIAVETTIGVHVYEVAQIVTVAPGDVWVTEQVEGAWLTLTTCNPRYSARERLILFARLVAGPNAAAVNAGLTGEETPPQPPAS